MIELDKIYHNDCLIGMKEIPDDIRKSKQEMEERFGVETMNWVREIALQMRKELVNGVFFNEPINGTWTYVIVDKDKNEHKIGISKNPLSRISSIMTSRPTCFLYLLHKCNLESMLHGIYADKRKYNEWFCLDEDDLVDLVCNFGFRFAPGLFNDGYERNTLYCVQESELRRSVAYFHHTDSPAYEEFYLLWKQTPKLPLTKQCEIANKSGLRTPTGKKWKPAFARLAMKWYCEANNLSHSDRFKKIV
jgi:hypothetical protein